MMKVNWSNLPNELLESIALIVITNVKDFVHFGAVCISWRSVFIALRSSFQLQIPWLLVQQLDDQSMDSPSCLFNPSNNTKIWLNEPNPSTQQLLGTDHGWLIIISKYSPEMYLLNPLTRTRISLPPATATPWVSNYHTKGNHNFYTLLDPHRPLREVSTEEFAWHLRLKSALSSHPSLHDGYSDNRCIVLIASGLLHQFLFCTPGDKSWTAIVDERGSAAELHVNWYSEIKYHNRRFYAVDNLGSVLVCDTGLSSRGITQIPSVTAFQKSPLRLVESLGELFFVRPRKIQVYKLDQSSNEIVEIKNLGDMALFIGCYNSLSLLAHNYPGLKQNCIYFMDGHRHIEYLVDGNGNISRKTVEYVCNVFNLENQRLDTTAFFSTRFELLIHPGKINKRTPQIIWVAPSLH